MGRLPRMRSLAVQLSLAAALVALLPSAASAQPAPQSGPPPASTEQQGPSNPALAQFREVLERSGTVANHPRYGEVWIPGVVPEGWSPYPPCRWTFDRQQNAWTYQDPTDWGSIVHHYGRWASDSQYGWMWIADANPGPGWVYWKNEGARVSWAALGPETDGQPVPTEGWHSQDQQIFNTGCRSAQPPAPTAYRGPPPGPVPVGAPPPRAYAAPAYPAPAPPVYVPGPPAPVYVPGPPVVVGGPPRPPVVVVLVPGSHCQRFPMSPACRPRPGPGPGPGPVVGPGPKPGPGPVVGPGPNLGPGGPGTSGPFKTQTDARKACELGNPLGCRAMNDKTLPRLAGLQRPTRATSPFMRPSRGTRPFAMRPNKAFRPMKLAGPRPTSRPVAFRPGSFRPGSFRPGGFRPGSRPVAFGSRPASFGSRPASFGGRPASFGGRPGGMNRPMARPMHGGGWGGGGRHRR